jgi:Family of unknown function (DUF6496)
VQGEASQCTGILRLPTVHVTAKFETKRKSNRFRAMSAIEVLHTLDHGSTPPTVWRRVFAAPIKGAVVEERMMARYGKAASKSVESAMRREKKGTLKSGKGGKGGTVKSRKQAIAIGLSEARKKGAKVPRKKSS